MKRSIYLFGFLASFLLSSGFIFKMMHWPAANLLIFSGFLVLNFAFLPVYFFEKFRSAK